MTLTSEGEAFICHAQKVLNQIEDIERMYKNGMPEKQRFSISVPRASYISDAFARFTKSIDASPAEIYYMEANLLKAVNNILNAEANLTCSLRILRHLCGFRRSPQNCSVAMELHNANALIIPKFIETY